MLSKAEAQSVLSGETTLKQVVRDGSVAAAAAAVDVELMNTTSKGKDLGWGILCTCGTHAYTHVRSEQIACSILNSSIE